MTDEHLPTESIPIIEAPQPDPERLKTFREANLRIVRLLMKGVDTDDDRYLRAHAEAEGAFKGSST